MAIAVDVRVAMDERVRSTGGAARQARDEAARRVREKFESGEFIAPRRPGIAYMLSDEIRNDRPRTKEVAEFPPRPSELEADLIPDLERRGKREGLSGKPPLDTTSFQ